MITRDTLTEIGTFNKAHGINGEISATIEDFDANDMTEFSCIVIDMDGIFVPFFINAARPKSNTTVLLTIDGVKSEEDTRQFISKPIYVLKDEVEEDSEDGHNASYFIGWNISDSEQGLLGEIIDIDDSTENYLFIVRRNNGEELLIPIAQEFIVAIDDTTHNITMDLPTGLI